MSDLGKGPIKDLPLKIILTNDGINFFIKNKSKLQKFKMADNVEEYGLWVDNFSPSLIQKMVLMNYVSKIEVSRAEFGTRKKEIMNLTKLLVYSVLYKQLDTVVFKKILESTPIKDWNRTHPGNVIDERSHIDETYLENILKKNEKQVQMVKKGILTPILNHINSDQNLLPEERRVKYLTCEKFLSNLKSSIWWILTKFQASKDYLTLLTDIRDLVMDYLEKTKIAEYLSLMVMELANNAENSNMQQFLKKKNPKNHEKVNTEAFLYDPVMRSKIFKEMEQENESLFLTWKIGIKSGFGTRNKLEVILYNRESEYQKVKQVIEDKKGMDLKKKSLTDFYKESPDNLTNSEVGLYYLSYLSEACQKVNVKFDSMVNQIQRSDLTVISMSLHF